MQNFGKIKNTFNGILVEAIVSKNDTNKSLFKKYVKTIKESEILRTQFFVYNNIENKVEADTNTAHFFVTENIKLMDKFDVDDIIKENVKLNSLLPEVSNEVYDSRISSLHESLSNLITTKKTASSIDGMSKDINNVVEYIKSNKLKESNDVIDLPNSMISTIMVDKYNEKYASLDESEKKVLKALIDSNDEQKKEVYSSIIRECIDLINDKLTNSDLDSKDKLLRVKDKMLNDKQEINEDFNKNISKLIELRGSLKNN
jgi:hypothetical protein